MPSRVISNPATFGQLAGPTNLFYSLPRVTDQFFTAGSIRSATTFPFIALDVMKLQILWGGKQLLFSISSVFAELINYLKSLNKVYAELACQYWK
jgi:hypothetical protein